jgi:hypothetical protein
LILNDTIENDLTHFDTTKNDLIKIDTTIFDLIKSDLIKNDTINIDMIKIERVNENKNLIIYDIIKNNLLKYSIKWSGVVLFHTPTKIKNNKIFNYNLFLYKICNFLKFWAQKGEYQISAQNLLFFTSHNVSCAK